MGKLSKQRTRGNFQFYAEKWSESCVVNSRGELSHLFGVDGSQFTEFFVITRSCMVVATWEITYTICKPKISTIGILLVGLLFFKVLAPRFRELQILLSFKLARFASKHFFNLMFKNPKKP